MAGGRAGRQYRALCGTVPVLLYARRTKQASPDTICSMIYDERLLDYWKINPDRYPDVVVFESCYGRYCPGRREQLYLELVDGEF